MSDTEVLAQAHDHILVFFFSSRRRHTRCGRDWSSDVCSSDLEYFQQSIDKDPAYAAAYAQLANTYAVLGYTGIDVRPSRERSEERRVGKECRSRWSPYH